MRPRLLAALIALAGLTAFAPAPFPKPRQERTLIDLTRFQGTWKVIGHHNYPAGQKQRAEWSITHIRIAKDRWTLLEAARENATYRIGLDPKKKPCEVDWRSDQGRILWMGIIRRDGDVVEVLYLSATQRPADFDKPPAGSYLITLRRAK
jgi:uncharacterized protein (TIGR03067 family)